MRGNKLNGWMEGIQFVEKFNKFVLTLCPNQKHIVNIPNPYVWLVFNGCRATRT